MVRFSKYVGVRLTMVILHVAQLYNNPCSGVEVVVPKHIIKQQEKEKVALINLSSVNIEGVNNQFSFCRLKNLDGLPKPFDKPDLVVFHEVYKPGFLRIAKYFKNLKIPYIVVPHVCLTLNAQKIKRLKKRIANFLFFNSFVLNARAIHCLSEKEKEQTNFKVEKFVCPNGVELPTMQKRVSQDTNTEIVYIGRLDRGHKGLDILIDAIALIKDFLLVNKVTIKLYGPDYNGTVKFLTQQIVERDIVKIVELHGSVVDEDKSRVLTKTNIFIQTSRFEGMPMGVLEALSYGKPCIATKGTTLAEIINEYDAGWGVEGNAESISNAIKQAIIERQRWHVLSLNARKLVEENFSWGVVASNTIKKYYEIINDDKC